MESLWVIVMQIIAIAPFIIVGVLSIVAAIMLIRKAVREDTHRVRNILLAIALFLVPALMYGFLYVLGRIITG